MKRKINRKKLTRQRLVGVHQMVVVAADDAGAVAVAEASVEVGPSSSSAVEERNVEPGGSLLEPKPVADT